MAAAEPTAAELEAVLKIRENELRWIADHSCRDFGHATPLDCRSEIRLYANGRLRADVLAEARRK